MACEHVVTAPEVKLSASELSDSIGMRITTRSSPVDAADYPEHTSERITVEQRQGEPQEGV